MTEEATKGNGEAGSGATPFSWSDISADFPTPSLTVISGRGPEFKKQQHKASLVFGSFLEQFLQGHGRISTKELLHGSQETTATRDENMDKWQEKYLDKVDQSISEMKFSLRETKEDIRQMISQTLSEMRDRDNQRHTEFLSMNERMDALQNTVKTEARQTKIGV